MKKKILLKLLFIIATFGALGYFFGSQISISDKIEEFPAFHTEVSATQIENVLPTQDVSTNPTNIEIDKNITNSNPKETTASPEILLLKEAFSKKYNKSVDSIFVVIEAKIDSYYKGSVDFDNSGYPATFYAFNNKDSFVIVAVENGVVPCNLISGYAFPNSIISQCYSQSSGSVVSR